MRILNPRPRYRDTEEVQIARMGSIHAGCPLFPALHRMEEEGWISAFWGDSENNRRAKYYRLTPGGRRRLAEETASWERFAAAIGKVLGATEQPA